MLSINVLVCFAAALTVCQSLPTELEFAGNPSRIFEQYIKYTLWTYNDNSEQYTSTALTDITASGIIAGDRVIVLVHGKQDSNFQNSFFTPLRRVLFNQRSGSKIIEVDWYLLRLLNFNDEFFVDFVGNNLAELINPAGGTTPVDLNLLHFVGFDIGAHIVGYASRNLGRIRKVTALSPVRTIAKNSIYCVSSADALYVEAIHSDISGNRAIGIAEQVGTVDIYLNSGTSQPNCGSNNECNHLRAVDVFIATVERNGHLSAYGCSTLADMTRNRCTNPPTIRVGTDSIADKGGRGIYRANTGGVYPY